MTGWVKGESRLFFYIHPEAPARQLEVFAVKVQPVLVDLHRRRVGAVDQLEPRHVGPQLLKLGHVQVHEALRHTWIC